MQFQVDGNSPTAGWNDCIADDATFDQTSESFSCSVGRLTAAEHTIYIRAYDSNTAYTAQANYTTLEVDLRRGVTKINSYSPNHTPPLIAGEAAVFTSGASGVIIEKGAIPYNAAFSSVSEPRTHEIRFTKGNSIPGLAIYSLWITDSFNQARILPSLHKKPSIVALSYSDHQINGISESSLRLAYSQDMQTWKILPTSVVDPVNNTVAALNKVGGYYMIVRSLGAPSRIYEDVQEKQIVSEKQEELIEKKAESESKYLNNSSKDISNKSTPSQSLFQRIINTLKSFFTPPF
ncbi:MAG: hypothetical protein ACE5DQ_00605 [Candidatus Paceibacterota bacterium]